MKNLKVKSLGPIKDAAIDFADLTLFVGPQASGKSILLQLVKLLLDKKHIRKTLEQYGFIWGQNEKDIIDRYFGEGMSGIFNSKTEINFGGKDYPLSFLLPKKRESSGKHSGPGRCLAKRIAGSEKVQSQSCPGKSTPL